ncbi:DnaJ domain-containing protein [Chitinophaga sp. SYP-B3965]|uniref:J domain-containing protein n=1 Tax=Chitinophaga sp. SYP-B3965 TaxID=2663120 RepID=UPI001299DDD3|nr:J domain-containing protein [Chitinophaga sp. SYP-B3965]MRG47962.1 DnaJ domain-containing protein [Chitinophaga sp. SYP-B3965]
MRNYYTILGIADFSDADTVKAAHRKLSKRYHPDLNNGNKYYEEKFREIQHAYERLRDPAIKEMYDHQLRYYNRPYVAPIPEQPIYTPPPPENSSSPILKWRRSRGAVIIFLMIMLYICRVTFSPPWSHDHISFTDSDTQQGTFKIGSEKEEVYHAQGKPHKITKDDGVEIWSYDNSYIIFKNDVVSSYGNMDNNLNIED